MSRLVLHTESSVKRDARVLLPVAFSEDVLFPIRTTRHPLHLLLNGGALPGRCDTQIQSPAPTNEPASKQPQKRNISTLNVLMMSVQCGNVPAFSVYCLPSCSSMINICVGLLFCFFILIVGGVCFFRQDVSIWPLNSTVVLPSLPSARNADVRHCCIFISSTTVCGVPNMMQVHGGIVINYFFHEWKDKKGAVGEGLVVSVPASRVFGKCCCVLFICSLLFSFFFQWWLLNSYPPWFLSLSLFFFIVSGYNKAKNSLYCFRGGSLSLFSSQYVSHLWSVLPGNLDSPHFSSSAFLISSEKSL